MKNLRNRTFDEYLALLGSLSVAFGLLRRAYTHDDRIALISSLVLLLPLAFLIAGMDRAKFIASGLFAAFGLYRLWACLFGSASWDLKNLVMIGVPLYIALLFWKWNYSAGSDDDLSDKDFEHLKEQLRSMDCTIGEGIDDRSFGVGTGGVATLVSTSKFSLTFQTIIDLEPTPLTDAEQAIYGMVNSLNGKTKLGKLTYEDGRLYLTAHLPAHDPDGFTIQSLFTLWQQDVMTVRNDLELKHRAPDPKHKSGPT